MNVAGWVKGAGTLLALTGLLFGVPVAVSLAALADGVTADRTSTQTAAIEPGATLSVEATSANLTILAGPAGQVRVDEHDTVRALTRRLAGITMARLHTSLEPGLGGLTVTPSSESFGTIAGFERREVTIYAPADVSVAVNIVSGDLRVSGVRGNISIVSESGTVRLEDMDVTGTATVHLVSGDVDFSGAIQGGQVELTTVSGSIHAYLPAGTNLHYQASTISGEIGLVPGQPRSVLGAGAVGQSASGDLGTGGPGSLTMNAISGNITLQTS